MLLTCIRRKMHVHWMDGKAIIIRLDNNNNRNGTTMMIGDPLQIEEEVGEVKGDLEPSDGGDGMHFRLKIM